MSSLYEKFRPGNIVSMDVYPSAIHGQLTHQTVTSILSYDAARRAGFDPMAEHTKVLSTLPADAPKNAVDYDYVALKNKAGFEYIVGLPWIVEASVEVHQTLTGHYVVDNVDLQLHERILAMFKEYGIVNVSGQLK